MKWLLRLMLLVGCSLLLCAQQGSRPIDNADVVSMTKAGLSEQTIVLAVQQGKPNFDTSPQALVDLKRNGVSDAVLKAMLQAMTSSNTSGRPSATSSGESGMSNQARPAPPGHEKGPTATEAVASPFGNFTVWIDPQEWKQVKSDTPGDLQFQNVNGEGFAKLISEKISIPMDAFPDIALENAKKVAPDAKIVLKENRVVNGKQVLVMQLDGTTSHIPFRFYGYYYGGSSGTIQLVTFTGISAFDRNAASFTKFLDGLVISDQPLASAPHPAAPTGKPDTDVLVVNDGRMAVQYDTNKWKQGRSDEPGRYKFEHQKGDAYGIVIAERIDVPTDSLPEVALTNAKKLDPNARITLREKRRVNGVDVWFLKMEVTAVGVPFTYYGYYYGGESGTIQVLTYTSRELVPDYDSDFMEFLNGFRLR